MNKVYITFFPLLVSVTISGVFAFASPSQQFVFQRKRADQPQYQGLSRAGNNFNLLAVGFPSRPFIITRDGNRNGWYLVVPRVGEFCSSAMSSSGDQRHWPSSLRNREVIATELTKWLTGKETHEAGNLLEIASGTGCHIETFAKSLPGWTFTPTEVRAVGYS